MKGWVLRLVCAGVITVGFSTPTPAELTQRPGRLRIVLVGDSTVADYAGWGRAFRALLSDSVECINAAADGRSSKSFIEEGRWAQALTLKGNYYLIQFGHNDEPGKGPARETDPSTTYLEYMNRYVDDARASGATPILITSLARRHFDSDGKIVSTLTPYVDAVKNLAATKKVPLLDLHARSIQLAEAMGQTEWIAISPRGPDGEVDRTHLTKKSGALIATLVARELRSAVPGLGQFIKLAPDGRQPLARSHERGVKDSSWQTLRGNAASAPRNPCGNCAIRLAQPVRKLIVQGLICQEHSPAFSRQPR